MRLVTILGLALFWLEVSSASAQAGSRERVLGRSREGVVVRAEGGRRTVLCVVRDDGTHRCSDQDAPRLRRARTALAFGGIMGVGAVATVFTAALFSAGCIKEEGTHASCGGRNGLYAIPFAVVSAGLFALGGVRTYQIGRDQRHAYGLVGWSDPSGLAFGRGLALRVSF